MTEWMTIPRFFCTVTENHDGTWTAIGSRKVAHLDLTANQFVHNYFEDDMLFGDSRYRVSDGTLSYQIEGKCYSMTLCTGPSPLAVLGQLLDSFAEEERKEEEDRQVAERKQELARFGGELDEELVRKIVKWRKKRGTVQD